MWIVQYMFLSKNYIYNKIDLTSVTGLMNITCINSFKNISNIIVECAIYPNKQLFREEGLIVF